MVQNIPLILGGLLVVLSLASFFRSLWSSRKRRRDLAGANDWDSPESVTGVAGGNPSDFGGYDGGHGGGGHH